MSIQQEDKIILLMCTSNNRASQYMRFKKMLELKEETDKYTVIVEELIFFSQ